MTLALAYTTTGWPGAAGVPRWPRARPSTFATRSPAAPLARHDLPVLNGLRAVLLPTGVPLPVRPVRHDVGRLAQNHVQVVAHHREARDAHPEDASQRLQPLLRSRFAMAVSAHRKFASTYHFPQSTLPRSAACGCTPRTRTGAIQPGGLSFPPQLSGERKPCQVFLGV